MSKLAVQQYYTDIDKLMQYGGTKKETAIRGAFLNLLNHYCEPKHFLLIPELDYQTKSGATVFPDGTIKDAMRLDWGWWESKDQDDDLNEEIRKKLLKGYPTDNILFEDSQTAVLIQRGEERLRVMMRDAEKLDYLLTEFISYERPEVAEFRKAIELFKADLPKILDRLREIIEEAGQANAKFRAARDKLLDTCRKSINPNVTPLDVREMLIQHILTEEIFLAVFHEAQFHRENAVAKELQAVTDTFLFGSFKKELLGSLETYYAAIRKEAARISNHHEKQKFLKVIYENFYKIYNPKAADRLGVVYTPNEIVRFMIESADYLVHKHFGKLLADPGVEILDPATGTGTFVTELLEYLPTDKLPHKYAHDIHCNEVAILPYYIANLNIEATYAQKTGQYAEFKNICFVDTLDNMGFGYSGKQETLFGFVDENVKRIKNQNDRKISVIIGNPPYNANQQNENDNNKNREYEEIDKLIKATYVKQSTAQKTKVYDMYARFFRWATNRLNNDGNGVLAFITNNSFVNKRTYDGFRRVVAAEFSEIYVVDLGGDVRENPKLSGTKHNVFGIQTGVAIGFFVKKTEQAGTCKIFYARRPEMATSAEKLEFLRTTKFQRVAFEHIMPDMQQNWINQADTDFETLLPLADKATKLTKSPQNEKAVFKLFSLGVKTNRDEWVCDFKKSEVAEKVNFLAGFYGDELKRLNHSVDSENVANLVGYEIKWTRALKKRLVNHKNLYFDDENIIPSFYRPFTIKWLYFSHDLNEDLYQLNQIFPNHHENIVICLSGVPMTKPLQTWCTKKVFHHDFLEKTQCLPFYRYDADGTRRDNITDWGLAQFRARYQDLTGFEKPVRSLEKRDIFHYVYAVLHHPAYRQKYELNLKREFPRIPLYADFWQWADWGRRLMDLHLNYETVAPYPLTRQDNSPPGRGEGWVSSVVNSPPGRGKGWVSDSEMAQTHPQPLPGGENRLKPKLKADKLNNTIIIDDATTLHGVPPEAWEYKLGNRSALEWVLDQYKEKTPKDPTIAAKFDTYRFADYKEQVLDLLCRVCAVSVETVAIVRQMEDEQ